MLLVLSVAVLIVAATATLSLIESALMYVDELRLSAILRRKPPNAAQIKYIIKHKRTHLSSMVVLITLVSIAGSSLMGALAARYLEGVWVVILTVLLTYCMLVFAKILPKLIAADRAGEILSRSAVFVRWCCFLMRPVLHLAMIWLRLFNSKKSPSPGRDELKGIIRYFNQTGVIDHEERKMTELVLRINQKTVESIADGAGQTVCVPASAPVRDLHDLIRQQTQKRYLAVENDRVVGVVLYRHITNCLVSGLLDLTAGELARPTIYLNRSDTLLDAIRALRKSQGSVALLANPIPEKTKLITTKQLFRAVMG